MKDLYWIRSAEEAARLNAAISWPDLPVALAAMETYGHVVVRRTDEYTDEGRPVIRVLAEDQG